MMKKILKSIMMLVLMTGSLVLGSCSNDANSPSNNSLKNTTWKATIADHEGSFTFTASTVTITEKDLSTGQSASLNANYTFDGTTVNMTFTSFCGFQEGVTLDVINATQPKTATISGNQLIYLNVVYTKQ